jgi:hypothetical protein
MKRRRGSSWMKRLGRWSRSVLVRWNWREAPLTFRCSRHTPHTHPTGRSKAPDSRDHGENVFVRLFDIVPSLSIKGSRTFRPLDDPRLSEIRVT